MRISLSHSNLHGTLVSIVYQKFWNTVQLVFTSADVCNAEGRFANRSNPVHVLIFQILVREPEANGSGACDISVAISIYFQQNLPIVIGDRGSLGISIWENPRDAFAATLLLEYRACSYIQGV